MADDEQFSLCWNNFNSNLSAGFHESLCRGDLVDVTLAAEGQFVKAHRLVLSVCSPYFRRMFTQMPANQHAFVFLKDVSHSALKDLIQFMYCGEVNVKQDALPAFISTAEALQIKGLTDSEPAPSQSPAKPSTPAPQQTIPAPTMTNVTTTSPRARSSNQRNRSSYKLESEDSGDENKPTNQLVLQSSSSQSQHQQQQTLVQQTQKRPAQRSITPQTVPTVKRIKNSDPLEGTEPTQITVQTVSDNKSNSGEAEFIDLPIDLPTKSEPDYTEDAGDVETAEQEATYVEDDSYGDMKYDESYFTENDETATVPTTSAATVKQSASFSESYVSDTGDQATTEAQDIPKRRGPGRPRKHIQCDQELRIDEIIDLALQEESEPVTYVSTIKGGMAVLYDGHHFKHSFKRKGCMVYRCIRYDSKKCPARIMVRQSLVYPVDLAHNHPDCALMEAHGVSVTQPMKQLKPELRNLNEKTKTDTGTKPVMYEIVSLPPTKQIITLGSSNPKINDIITMPSAKEIKPIIVEHSLADVTITSVKKLRSDKDTPPNDVPADPAISEKRPNLKALSSQDLKEKMKRRLQVALLRGKK